MRIEESMETIRRKNRMICKGMIAEVKDMEALKTTERERRGIKS